MQFIKDNWFWEILVVILFIIIVRIKKRGYFWKAKNGEKLTLKQFFKRWGKGVEGITPVQQTLTTLISLFPILAGAIWGSVVTFLGGIWWASLMLIASIPIQIIQIIANWQKYKRLKQVEDTIKQINLEQVQRKNERI